jgi:hypothetical protein
MSAKKVSKMCIFVHKLVEIARFSPRKVQKRGFFAGGRGDFLAGQKRGFLGSRESRASGAASCENRSQSLTPAMAASQHQAICCKIIIKIIIRQEVCYACIVEKSIIGHSYRHSELAERTESVNSFNNHQFYNISTTSHGPAQRG